MDPLTPTDHAVINLAGRTYRHRGAMIDAVRNELGLSYTAYTLHLRDLTRIPAAWEHAPRTMSRATHALTTRRRAGDAR